LSKSVAFAGSFYHSGFSFFNARSNTIIEQIAKLDALPENFSKKAPDTSLSS